MQKSVKTETRESALMRRQLFLSILVMALLAACSGGAVVFAPTALPPNRAPVEYRHPGGAFSVRVPRDWAVHEQNTTTLASAAFSAPGADEAALFIAVIRLDSAPDSTAFGALIDRYQTQVRDDVSRYTEADRQAMADGSWRMSGIRADAGGGQPVNTFIEHREALLAVTDVIVPQDEAARRDLQASLNTLQLTDTNALEPTSLSTLAFAHPQSASILHVSTWTTPDGVFFITGEVANTSADTLVDVPVEAALVDANGLSLAGAVDNAMGRGIPPGGFAPFSLRFGGGQPTGAVSYALTLGAGAAAETPLLGDEALEWTDAFAFDEREQLLIQGDVTNISGEAVRALRAVATVFDGAQNVIGAGYVDFQPGTLQPGETAPYSIRLPELGGEPVNYIVVVQGAR